MTVNGCEPLGAKRPRATLQRMIVRHLDFGKSHCSPLDVSEPWPQPDVLRRDFEVGLENGTEPDKAWQGGFPAIERMFADDAEPLVWGCVLLSLWTLIIYSMIHGHKLKGGKNTSKLESRRRSEWGRAHSGMIDADGAAYEPASKIPPANGENDLIYYEEKENKPIYQDASNHDLLVRPGQNVDMVPPEGYSEASIGGVGRRTASITTAFNQQGKTVLFPTRQMARSVQEGPTPETGQNIQSAEWSSDGPCKWYDEVNMSTAGANNDVRNHYDGFSAEREPFGYAGWGDGNHPTGGLDHRRPTMVAMTRQKAAQNQDGEDTTNGSDEGTPILVASWNILERCPCQEQGTKRIIPNTGRSSTTGHALMRQNDFTPTRVMNCRAEIVTGGAQPIYNGSTLGLQTGVKKFGLGLVDAVLDTGACTSLISPFILPMHELRSTRKTNDKRKKIVGLAGSTAELLGETMVRIRIGTRWFEQECCIASSGFDVILGNDFLMKYAATLKMRQPAENTTKGGTNVCNPVSPPNMVGSTVTLEHPTAGKIQVPLSIGKTGPIKMQEQDRPWIHGEVERARGNGYASVLPTDIWEEKRRAHVLKGSASYAFRVGLKTGDKVLFRTANDNRGLRVVEIKRSQPENEAIQQAVNTGHDVWGWPSIIDVMQSWGEPGPPNNSNLQLIG